MKPWSQAVAEAAEREACRKLALDLAERAEQHARAGGGFGSPRMAYAQACRDVAAAIEARGRTLQPS